VLYTVSLYYKCWDGVDYTSESKADTHVLPMMSVYITFLYHGYHCIGLMYKDICVQSAIIRT